MKKDDFPVCQAKVVLPCLRSSKGKPLLIDGRTKPMLLWMFDSRADNDAL